MKIKKRKKRKKEKYKQQEKNTQDSISQLVSLCFQLCSLKEKPAPVEFTE